MASQFSITNTGTFDILAGSNISGKPFTAGPIPPTGVVTSNLLLHLDAANATSYPGSGTTWFDLSGNGNNFTLVNSPTFVSNGNASAFDFLPSSFQHAISTGSIDLQRNFTLEMWLNADSLAGSLRGIFGQGVAQLNKAIAIFIRDKVLFSMYGNDFEIATTFTTGIWYHVVCTYNHSSPFQKQVYRNGSLLGQSTSGQAQYQGTGALRVGAPYGALNQEMMDGKIGIARAYSKILSAAEILQNYNAEKSRYGL